MVYSLYEKNRDLKISWLKFFEIYPLTIYTFIYNAWWQKKLQIILYLYVNTFNQITASEMFGFLLPSHYVLFKLSPFVHANYLDWLRNASCSNSKFDNTWFMYTFKVQWLIDWLVFNANLSSISAILWHQCLGWLIDWLVFNANLSSISAILWHQCLGWLIDWCLTPTWVVFQLYCGINALVDWLIGV